MRAIVLVASLGLSGVAAAEQCPADFDEFIAAFETSAEFQVAHWKRPVKYQYLEAGAEDEPKRIEVAVTLENAGEYAGIEFPSTAAREQESLQTIVSAPDPKTRVVRLVLPDSDFQIDYEFKQTAACWELARVEDMSL